MLTREDVAQFRHWMARGNHLDMYQELSSKSAIYPGKGTPAGLTYVGLKMNGEAGEFAEHLGKAMRDEDFGQTEWVGEFVHKPLLSSRRELLIKEIGDVLWYASAACTELGITLSEAAAINLEKLADRAERDVLRGSGDER